MTIHFRPAKRENVALLIGIAGPSGSGKTYSAMRIAKGLASRQRFAVIDTENGRAKHYADEFEFDHADLAPPFRPQTYLQAIQDAAAAGYGVIVVDSASHEYSGPGGLLDWWEEELDRMAGDDSGKRTRMSAPAWTAPKLAHARFVTELLRIPAHIILCFRARQAIEIVREGGKTIVRPTTAEGSLEGWTIDTEHKRMPLHFELTTSFFMLSSKPGIPQPIKLPEKLRPFVPADRPVTEKVGEALAQWAGGGSPTRNGDAPKAGLPEHLVHELVALKAQAGPPPDEWVIEKLVEVGVAVNGDRVSLATIRSLTEDQAHGLMDALNAIIAAKEEDVAF